MKRKPEGQLSPEQRAAMGKKEQARIATNIGYTVLFIWGLFFLLAARYAWIQLVQGEALAARVRHETGAALPMQSPRGAILDRNGREMAISIMMKSLFVDPSNVEPGKEQEVAEKLAPLVGLTPEAIMEDIAQGGGFVWVKHYLSSDEVAAVRKLIREEEYNCLGFQPEPKRSYPNGELAANIVGFVGADDIGLNGIEQEYDSLVKGGASEAFIQTDNVSDRPILGSVLSRRNTPQSKCKTVQLTIDTTLQFMVEEVLEEALAETNPQSVTAVVMNPKTGEILAMASRPSYDPNRFEDFPMENWTNRAVSYVYEPGSTFKSIVAAAALQEGLVSPNDYFLDPGYVIVSERRIENWSGGSFGTVTFTEIVKQSINTCFALLGLEIGGEKLTDYAKKFGFGEATGIELPAEAEGILFPDPAAMGDSDIATMSIGQSIAVTPIQLVTAMSAIANDGVLMKPHIVKAVYNADGSVYEEMKPEPVRRVIDSATDKTLMGLLEQVVATGGGKKARVQGYRITGKTGTAEKIRTDSVGYKEGSYIASFCGFAPVDDPQVTLLVIIDDPSGIYYGGQIAAPVAAKMFQQLFRSLNIEPSADPFEERTGGETVGATREGEKEKEAPAKDTTVTVPSVIGLDAAEAQLRLEEAGLRIRAEGRGKAVSQSVPAGVGVRGGAEIIVRFAPQ